MRKILLPGIFILFSFSTKILAQQRSCATNEVVKQQMAVDPAYARKLSENERKFKEYRSKDNSGARQATINIPVVVHVVYNTAGQNISDAQVQSQIDVLNEDFTATNKDYNNYDAGYTAVKGDVDIKFCLAQVIHKATDKKSFGVNDQVKSNSAGGSDPVDPMHFLNVWVCNLGQNVLGYAYYPGIKAEKYGAVIHYLSFGRGNKYNFFADYNLGRTATHEIGHCLGLVHIWGDKNCGDDQVDDTPLHNGPNFGCPEHGLRSTCVGEPIQMTMNYMDYTDDRCMYFFTDGQAARADFFMSTDPQLNSIINSTCSRTQRNTIDVITLGSKDIFNSSRVMRSNDMSLYPTITSGQLTLLITNSSNERTSINIFNQTGALMMKQQIVVSGKASQLDVSRLANGIYFLESGQGVTKQTRKFIVQH